MPAADAMSRARTRSHRSVSKLSPACPRKTLLTASLFRTGPSLHDLPFSPQRGSPQSASPPGSHRHSGGSWQPPSRPTSHYDRSGTYPPPRGTHHPSLSHSTHGVIPTPAQAAQTYHHSYGGGSGLTSSPASSSPTSTSALPVVAAIPPASAAAPAQERFFCDRCDKSFGRAHDKKRHYESTHMQQSHTCRFCNKTFSRNDSLKRHQDNGCDKDPEFNP